MSLEQLELPHTRPSQPKAPRAKPEVRYKDWTFVSHIMGLVVHDMPKIKAAPKHEFRRYYLGQMQAYFDEDKKTGRGPRMCFDGCKKTITTARELRRYFGRDMCPKCLKERRKIGRQIEQVQDREYFDLVESI